MADLRVQDAELDRRAKEAGKYGSAGDGAVHSRVDDIITGQPLKDRTREDVEQIMRRAALDLMRLKKDPDAPRILIPRETEFDRSTDLLQALGTEATIEERRKLLRVRIEATIHMYEQMTFEDGGLGHPIEPRYRDELTVIQPMTDVQLWTIIAVTPFATFALIVGLFTLIEHPSAGRPV